MVVSNGPVNLFHSTRVVFQEKLIHIWITGESALGFYAKFEKTSELIKIDDFFCTCLIENDLVCAYETSVPITNSKLLYVIAMPIKGHQYILRTR